VVSINNSGDTSVLTKLFHHNTWANLRLLDFCGGLTDEQLDATTTGCYGSIRDTLRHFIGGEVDYVNLANDKLIPPMPLPSDDFPGFDVLKEGARWAGDELLKLAVSAREDTIVRVTRPNEPIYEYPLASFMVQVLNHSTEHRTQIATILTQLGMEPPRLSGWAYMREMGEFFEFSVQEGERS
jgi:uncharacterized damage-inducible protein DinB